MLQEEVGKRDRENERDWLFPKSFHTSFFLLSVPPIAQTWLETRGLGNLGMLLPMMESLAGEGKEKSELETINTDTSQAPSFINRDYG